MSKTVWCRSNGLSEKQLFYWQHIWRREAYEASQNPSLSVVAEIEQLAAGSGSIPKFV